MGSKHLRSGSKPRLTIQKRRPASRGTLRLALVLGGLVLVNLYVFLWRDGSSLPDVMEKAEIAGDAQPVDELLVGSAGPATDIKPVTGQPESKPEWRLGTVGKGDSLGRILRREGLEPADADALIRSLNGHLEFKSIRAGQHYRLRTGTDGRLDGFEFEISKIKKARAERGSDGAWKGERIEEETEARVEEIGGTINSSLYMAFKARGEDTRLVSFFVDVFAYDLNFYVDQHKGDKFKVIVEKIYYQGEFLRHGRILAAEYSGKEGTFRAFWHQPEGEKEGKYYDEKGRGLERTFLKTPLKYTRISSKFNRNRMHPVLHRKRAHLGIDFAAPTGTPIRAAADGVIVQRGWCGGAGNCVVLSHRKHGLTSIYMHMSKFKKGQKRGQRVRAKDVIGYVGMTGLATGPHLHFGVKRKGRYIDPLKLKMERVMAITKKQRPAFEAQIQPVLAALGKVDTNPKSLEELGVRVPAN
ncbi:MAG: peptidoglycan DD-metalloendopeptidase family protein [Deltaproteobacteria bacterium]|nr:peptidoglycan DD-metalloendopeptidase family protein [Deltaproteobacteria bacterium]